MQDGWTEYDGQLLRSLRERVGVDRASFARACTLSVAQLAELEQGGNGRFYNDRIKAHTGRTLLKKLGHVPEPPKPQSEPEPEPEPVLALAAADEAVAPSVDASPVAEAPPEDTAPAEGSRRWGVRAGVGIAAVVALGVILMPRTARDSRQVVNAPLAPSSVPVAALAPQEPAASAASVASSQPAVAQAPASASCDLPPRDTIAPYTPPNALRPNNYVYIESARETRVCVVDSQNRQTVAIVKPGENASVYGTPPFTVQARQWAELRVFYQGVRVTLDSPTPPSAVLLNPR